jgi:hypothetical protein
MKKLLFKIKAFFTMSKSDWLKTAKYFILDAFVYVSLHFVFVFYALATTAWFLEYFGANDPRVKEILYSWVWNFSSIPIIGLMSHVITACIFLIIGSRFMTSPLMWQGNRERESKSKRQIQLDAWAQDAGLTSESAKEALANTYDLLLFYYPSSNQTVLIHKMMILVADVYSTYPHFHGKFRDLTSYIIEQINAYTKVGKKDPETYLDLKEKIRLFFAGSPSKGEGAGHPLRNPQSSR